MTPNTQTTPSKTQAAVLEKLTRKNGRILTSYWTPLVMWNDPDASRHAQISTRTLNALFKQGWVHRGGHNFRTIYISDAGREALERSRA